MELGGREARGLPLCRRGIGEGRVEAGPSADNERVCDGGSSRAAVLAAS